MAGSSLIALPHPRVKGRLCCDLLISPETGVEQGIGGKSSGAASGICRPPRVRPPSSHCWDTWMSGQVALAREAARSAVAMTLALRSAGSSRSKQIPGARDTLEVERTALSKFQSSARHQIGNNAGHKDLVGD